jgi:hypothetical protein
MDEEPTEVEAEEEVVLDWQPDGIPLKFNTGYYAHASNSKSEQDYLAVKRIIEDRFATGTPVYVQIMDDRRKGSIGKLTKATFHYQPANANSYWGRYPTLNIAELQVEWDGRRNKVAPYANEVEFLPNYQGPTVWQWNKGPAVEKPPAIIAYDHLGQELEKGQFVCFVHRRYGNVAMKFGTVTRFTDKGGVFIKTLKLRDGDAKSEEVRALDMEDVIICNDKLIPRLVMARLAAD